MDDLQRSTDPESESLSAPVADFSQMSDSPPKADELQVLRAQFKALEAKLRGQDRSINLLKQRLSQQEAQLRDTSRLAKSLATSRIWTTLATVGGWLLQAQQWLARVKAGAWRQKSPTAVADRVEVHCDHPRNGQSLPFGHVLIQGWAVAKSGIAKVEIFAGPQPGIAAKTGIYREDVGRVFPGFEGSQSAGFRTQIDLTKLAPGEHTLRIRAESRQGAVAFCERIITVDPGVGEGRLTIAESLTALRSLQNRPVFSLIVPVYNVPEVWLRRCLNSVLRQTYPQWELCIANDASSEPHIRPVLEEYCEKDKRIKVVHCLERGHIAGASNAALALATGEFVALLDNDDEITDDALLEIARALDVMPSADMVYSDEDKIDEDNFCSDPFFKPDWSPEYFLTCMYTCHLGVYRTRLVRECGGFRPEVNGAQDYDLALRIVSKTDRVLHVPKVLYHWRTLPQSTASGGGAKSYAYVAAQEALRNYLKINDIDGAVLPGPREGFHRIHFEIKGEPLVSIVIPSAGRSIEFRGRNIDLLQHCVESIRGKSTWSRIEIVVVDNGDLTPKQAAVLDAANVKRVTYTAPLFNLADKINLGCARASGEHLILLNDDIEVLSPDWIESMLQYSQQPNIGAVGAKLLFPTDQIQHAGVVLLGGNPGHPYYNHSSEDPGYYLSAQVARNYLAVTGACLMTKATLYKELKGFDSIFPLNYNDVDYCLRVHERGLRIVYTPYAELYHYESMSKVGAGSVGTDEMAQFQWRWLDKYYVDPYYNPNLPLDYPYYRVD